MNKFSKTKASPILNILGMTIAFAAFYVIMSQVMYDLTYNRSIKDAEKKYMICASWANDEWTSKMPLQTSRKAAESIPGAKIGFLRFQNYGDKVYAGEEGNPNLYHLGIYWFTKSGADILGVEFVSGSFPETEEGVAISEKAASLMSVSQGETIYVFDIMQQKKVPATVTGIYRTFAENSDLDGCDVIQNKEETILAERDNNFNYNGIVSFANQEDKEKFYDQYVKYYREFVTEMAEIVAQETGEEVGEDFINENARGCKLIPLSEVHLSDEVYLYVHNNTSRSTLYTLVGIAALIVLIAFINFVNFFVALVPEKIRSVNIRKVFGASRTSLIWEFVKEALIYVGVAIVLACILILAITKSPVNELTEGSIGFEENLLTFGILIVVSVVFAVLSALFPALYVTRIDAAMGVRSGFSRSMTGRALRKSLITVQLTVAVTMMVISAVFYSQYLHMTRQELRLDKENLYVMGIPYYQPQLKSRVESIPEIVGVTASNNQITGNAGMTQAISDGEVNFTLSVRSVLPNYFDVLGIKMLSGEGMTESSISTLILSAKAKELYSEAQLEQALKKNTHYELKGFCIDTNSRTATDKSVNGIDAYRFVGSNYLYYYELIFRTSASADAQQVLTKVRDIVRELYDLDEDTNVWTVDDELTERYARFKKQSFIVALFSLVAIIIALMGVFGIVLFETEHRRHETAVRKVLGAEGNDIVSLFCKQYVVTVIIACLLATPVAIYVTREWLEQFTTQVSVSPWLYLAAFAIVAILTLGIIIVRTISAAKENPVNNLKSE
ncbi:MAG: FtsX-like permease family protein [Bacteroidales bacterium]|nr:FtsX-like permease family protein [Bacteroidales bacterium]